MDETAQRKNETPQPKTISVVEAGRYFGLKRAGSYAAAARGDLPVIRVGRRLRVSVAGLERMLREARPQRVTLEDFGQLGDDAA